MHVITYKQAKTILQHCCCRYESTLFSVIAAFWQSKLMYCVCSFIKFSHLQSIVYSWNILRGYQQVRVRQWWSQRSSLSDTYVFAEICLLKSA